MRVKDNPICFNGNKKYPEKAKKGERVDEI